MTNHIDYREIYEKIRKNDRKGNSDYINTVQQDPLGFFDDILEDIIGSPPDPKLKRIYGGLDNSVPYSCLSVRQPYADLLVKGIKDVENRTWDTHYRGPLIIHSVKKPKRDEFNRLKRDPMYSKYLTYNILRDYYNGYILGIVNIVNCIQKNYASIWCEPKMWHWIIEDAIEFDDPIQSKGALGIWKFPDSNDRIKKEIKKAIRK